MSTLTFEQKDALRWLAIHHIGYIRSGAGSSPTVEASLAKCDALGISWRLQNKMLSMTAQDYYHGRVEAVIRGASCQTN